MAASKDPNSQKMGTFNCKEIPEITFSFPIYEGYRLLELKAVKQKGGDIACAIEFAHEGGLGENPAFLVSRQNPTVPVFKSSVNPHHLAYIVIGDEAKMVVFFWGDGIDARGISVGADYPSRHNFKKREFFDHVIRTMKRRMGTFVTRDKLCRDCQSS